jgi:hypothetical protein
VDGNFVLLSCIHILVDVLNEPAGARLPPTLSPGYTPGPFLLTVRASIAMTTLELPGRIGLRGCPAPRCRPRADLLMAAAKASATIDHFCSALTEDYASSMDDDGD